MLDLTHVSSQVVAHSRVDGLEQYNGLQADVQVFLTTICGAAYPPRRYAELVCGKLETGLQCQVTGKSASIKFVIIP